MAIEKITTDRFDDQVLASDRPVLVDFFAEWCGPCQRLAPVVEEVAKEADDIMVCKVDIDAEPQLAKRYGVMGVPTLAVFREGKLVKTAIGYCDKQQLLDLVRNSAVAQPT